MRENFETFWAIQPDGLRLCVAEFGARSGVSRAAPPRSEFRRIRVIAYAMGFLPST